MTLTIEKLLELCHEYKKPKPTYYITSKFIPDKDRFWRIPMYGEEVWIVHPDSLDTFERTLAAGNIEIEKFKVTEEMILAEVAKLQQRINTKLLLFVKNETLGNLHP